MRGLDDEKIYTSETKPGDKLTLWITKKGNWRIDQVPGKSILILEIKNRAGFAHSYTPKHDDICAILEAMFKVELENDGFTFSNGKIGDHRPAELIAKIARVEALCRSWRNKLANPREPATGGFG